MLLLVKRLLCHLKGHLRFQRPIQVLRFHLSLLVLSRMLQAECLQRNLLQFRLRPPQRSRRLEL
jgi:hypothetical protein